MRTARRCRPDRPGLGGAAGRWQPCGPRRSGWWRCIQVGRRRGAISGCVCDQLPIGHCCSAHRHGRLLHTSVTGRPRAGKSRTSTARRPFGLATTPHFGQILDPGPQLDQQFDLPADFLDVAESSGLIIPIGGWVITEACRQQAAWQTSLDRPLQMAVNLSGRQLLQADLCEHVSAAIDRAAIDPARLTLELTETVFTQASRSFLTDLETLKARGVRFALDDFGTGFSSLAYLERFPVDVVKIGPTFVAGLGTRTQDTTLVTAIVNLGHTLHLTVVAEGVETPDQLAALQDMGCDLVQGFHFARPSPADRIPGMLAAIRNPVPGTGARR